MSAVEKSSPADDDAARHAWAVEWLTTVADGSNTMSQRKLATVPKWGGGIDAIKAVAQSLGVHLLQLADDKGDILIVASNKPFCIIC